MMQVSNFAGPKMGGPKNSDCWNTWHSYIHLCSPKMPTLPIFELQAVWHSWCLVLKTYLTVSPVFFLKRSWSFPRWKDDRDLPGVSTRLDSACGSTPKRFARSEAAGVPQVLKAKLLQCLGGVLFTEFQQQWHFFWNILVAIPVDQEISRDIWMIFIYI